MSEFAFAESLTVDQMRVLVAVVDSGSFSGASNTLERSQSAISYQVKTLEAQLDLVLFRRTRRRPELTDAGRSILMAAREVLASVDGLRARARALGAGVEARVRLAIDVLYPAKVLAQRMIEFNEQLPSVEVDLRMGVWHEPVRSLNEGVVDVAVVPSPDPFEARLCHEAQLVPVVGSSHPLAASKRAVSDTELARYLHLVLSEGAEAGSSETAGAGPSWRINDSAARRGLVLAGVGWCHMPRHQIEQELADHRLVPLRTQRRGHKPMIVPLFAAHGRERSLGPAARWWFEHL